MDQYFYDGRIIWASYGTTKYCTYFLKNKTCTNKNCLYLHKICNDNEMIAKVSGDYILEILNIGWNSWKDILYTSITHGVKIIRRTIQIRVVIQWRIQKVPKETAYKDWNLQMWVSCSTLNLQQIIEIN